MNFKQKLDILLKKVNPHNDFLQIRISFDERSKNKIWLVYYKDMIITADSFEDAIDKLLSQLP